MLRARRRLFRGGAAFAMALTIVAAQACFEAHDPIDLKAPAVLPVLSPEMEAPKDAAPISMVRPHDLRADKTIWQFTQHLINHSFFVGNDPAVWVGNSLGAGLENAGYKIQRVETLDAVRTPVAITTDLTQLSFDAQMRAAPQVLACTAQVQSNVKLYKGGQQILERFYHNEYSGGCNITLPEAFDKAMKNLLDYAIPDLAVNLAKANKSAAPPLGASVK